MPDNHSHHAYMYNKTPFSQIGLSAESRDHFEGYAATTDSFSFGNRFMSQHAGHNASSLNHDMNGPPKFPLNPATLDLASRLRLRRQQPIAMPPPQVMTKLILIMVWRKLLRNPNTYSSLLGLIWSLVSARYVCISMYQYVSVCISMYVSVCTYVCMYQYVCISMYVSVCMYVCMYQYVCMYSMYVCMCSLQSPFKCKFIVLLLHLSVSQARRLSAT